MKRILTLIAVFAMTLSAMGQNAGILLSYNKGTELKTFKSNEMHKAIAAAEDNDTIYLSAGSYDLSNLPSANENSSERIWTKPLVIIGSGAVDQSDGSYFSNTDQLYIQFDENIPVEKRNLAFEGVRMPFWIRPACEINELSFRNFKGRFTDENNLISTPEDADDTWEKPHTYIQNLVFDRCVLEGSDNNLILQERNVDNVQINNTKIHGYISGGCSMRSGKPVTLDHCTVQYVNEGFVGLFQRSFIDNYNARETSNLEECGIYSPSDPENLGKDCFHIGDWNTDNENSANHGNCSDGTYFGTAGGSTPLTLYPSYPTLDTNSSKIVYFNGTLSIEVSLLGAKKEANE